MVPSALRFGIPDPLVGEFERAGWLEGDRIDDRAAAVLEAIRSGPDPVAGLDRMATLLGASPDIGARCLDNPGFGRRLAALVGASRALTGLAARNPRWVLDPSGEALEAEVLEAPDRPGRMRALRHMVQRRLLEIAAADLDGSIDMPDAGRALAGLADAAARVGLLVAEEQGREAFADLPPVPFSVIAMGKWGGRELNYSSDVDLLFVYGVPEGAEPYRVSRYAERVARGFLEVVGATTADGYAFRVDADLRPEGKDGPLARSLDSYRAYYEKWADTWEFQALIKARPAAGDERLSAAFVDMVAGFVYPEQLPVESIREVRLMKHRMEEQAARRGLDEAEIKRGMGGIRDVEFAVQLLQLVHGRFDLELRSPTTLEILRVLGQHGYVQPEDAADLAAAYVWLRNLEHRIQLYELRQTHELPSDPVGRERVGKSMGYRDTPGATALDSFEADLVRHRATVRTIHERLFYRPLLEAFGGTSPALPAEEAARRLAALGFADTTGAERAFADLTAGLSRRSRLMQQLLPVMLDWLSASPDPDLGLAQLRLLVTSTEDNTQLVGALRDSPVAAERLCSLLGTSRLLGRLLDRIPEALPMLADDTRLGRATPRDELVDEAVRRVVTRTAHDSRLRSIRRFTQRRILQAAARDLLGFATPEEVAVALSDGADAVAAAALWTADAAARERPEFAGLGTVPFAVIAMGKWGGRELHFGSDLDLLFVYDPAGVDPDRAGRYAVRVAEGFIEAVGGVTPEGVAFRVDTDLRPEGKDGPLVRSIDSYRAYYERWADTWEYQALIKARPAAGDPGLGGAFQAMVEPHVYPAVPDPERIRNVKTMKARIERDRLGPGEDPAFHLKLGKGGLVDVEFTAQLLQVEHGGGNPALRAKGTLAALAALAAGGHLVPAEEAALREAYRFCTRVRNRLFLMAGRPRDSLPTDPEEATRLALSLGYVHTPRAALREEYRRVTRRARRVVEHFFYGAPAPSGYAQHNE